MTIKRLPAGVAATIFILIAECVFLARTPPMTGQPLFEPTADDAVVQAKLDLMPLAAGRVALVGDSSCFMGIDPRELPQPAVNLGTLSSLTMAGYAAMVRDVVQRLEPPKRVIVAVLPRALEVSAGQARDFQLVGRTFAATGWDTPLFRASVIDSAAWFGRKHQINTFPPEFGGSYRAFAAELSKNDGYRPETKSHIEIVDVRDEFRPTPFAVENLRQLTRDCTANGVPVILWWSPSPEPAQTGGYLDEVREWTEAFAASEPGLRVPRSTPPSWPVEWFATESHVNARGVARNTQELRFEIGR